MTELQKTVNALLKKATEADSAIDALQFSQAAVNAANTYNALKESDR